MRIFIGFEEIGNFVTTYAKGFRRLGHEAYTMVSERSSFYPEAKYDVILSDILSTPVYIGWRKLLNIGKWKRVMLLQFVRALRSNDVFIFVFGTSFFPSFIDYAILKLFRKKIVSVFLGSDIRYWYAFREKLQSLAESHQYSCPEYNEQFYGYRDNLYETQLRKVKAAERYSDIILSHPDMDQLQSRPYMRVSTPLDLSQFQFSVPNRKAPLLLHAPSSREVKGTKQVLAAIEHLRHQGVAFEFKLIEKIPNSQLRQMLADADIVIDQLWLTTVGILALESMATGNAVLAGYLPGFSGIPADCPVVNVTPENLAEKLREVILNRAHRHALAYAGRSYVEKYHDHVHIAQQILDWLKPGGIQEYDFKPTFFENEFVMPAGLLEEERKKLRELRSEGWPKRISNVFRGERAIAKS